MSKRGRRSKAQIQADQEALARLQATQGPPPRQPGDGMDIAIVGDRLPPVLFTRYRGHKFEGWLSQDVFARLEEDGVLVWDASGKPVIDESKIKPPTAERGSPWIGEGI